MNYDLASENFSTLIQYYCQVYFW